MRAAVGGADGYPEEGDDAYLQDNKVHTRTGRFSILTRTGVRGCFAPIV